MENLSSGHRRPAGDDDYLAARGRSARGGHREGQSPARNRGGTARGSCEGPVMGLERRGRAGKVDLRPTPLSGEEPMGRPEPKVKSFDISKRLVFGAWEKVRDNAGAPGVDAVSVSQFQERERDSLYKLWNRMSAGSYMPVPVRAVEIPKDHGSGDRVLGVPSLADRHGQTAAARVLEEKLEPIFHPDSYVSRPRQSAHDALAVARKRCWN